MTPMPPSHFIWELTNKITKQLKFGLTHFWINPHMLQIPEVLHMLSLHCQNTDNSGVLTPCVESSLPYCDAGTDNPTRKRADRMTLTGCGDTPNAKHIFSVNPRLIMDVTIRHVFDTHHNFKPNALRSLSNSKCLKYTEHYQWLRLAFAPIVEDLIKLHAAANQNDRNPDRISSRRNVQISTDKKGYEWIST